jgi:hypothetical protein
VARRIEKVEFLPSDPDPVLRFMEGLAVAQEGWINLLPGVETPEEVPVVGVGLSALFGGHQPGVTMCTWVPPKAGRRSTHQVTVGIMHPRGRHAARLLETLGIALPPGGRVKQDHQRRGLLVTFPAAESPRAVLEWALRAGAALSTETLTGSWQAVVYLPKVQP